MGFFELGTAENMLEKARRELARLEADVSIDHAFNFFVTAYHISDYLDVRLKKRARKKSWLMLCGDACNKAKHKELDVKFGRPDPKTPKHHHLGLQTAGAPLDISNSSSVEWCIVWQDGTSRKVVSFAS
jgi:hypothetical protein